MSITVNQASMDGSTWPAAHSLPHIACCHLLTWNVSQVSNAVNLRARWLLSIRLITAQYKNVQQLV